MVGYYKHDNLTTNQKLIAGIISGVTTRCVTQPLDIIKLRTQVQKKKLTKKYRIIGTAKRIFYEEGITAFWHGHVLGQIHSILSVSSQFYVYELSTKHIASLDLPQKYSPYTRFICGVFAGSCSATLAIPLEVIRVRQMLVKDQYKGVLKGAEAVYRYGGFFAFYEGLSASILQLGPQVGISFVVFSYAQPMILKQLPRKNRVCTDEVCPPASSNKYSAQNLVVASSLAGSLAGIMSKSFTYPLDLAKRRLQIGSHKVSSKYNVPSTSAKLIRCRNLVDCMAKTFRKQGIRGLFQGLTVTIWKANVTSVIAFTSYELLCFALREYNDMRIPK